MFKACHLLAETKKKQKHSCGRPLKEVYASVRFSDPAMTKTDLTALMPKS